MKTVENFMQEYEFFSNECVPVETTDSITKRWENLAWEAGRAIDLPEGQKPRGKGSIVITGHGIKSVGQLTLETLSHLRDADIVFYYASDPITEACIMEIRPDAYDIYVFYGNGKNRISTYMQMSESIMHCVRKGMRVVCCFYGHPGVFVYPSHRMLNLCETENLEGKMLAAPSAEDCLFAEVGVDPTYPGFLTLEASDLLVNNRVIKTELHVIIWQVGCVGQSGFIRKGKMNEEFMSLAEYLVKVYGPDHKFCHYLCSEFPNNKSTIEYYPLKYLLDAKNHEMVVGCSTFYIPPKDIKPANGEAVKKFQIENYDKTNTLIKSQYDEEESDAIRSLSNWHYPDNHKIVRSGPLTDLMIDLSLDPVLLRKIQKEGYPKLANAFENQALQSNDADRIYDAMLATKSEMAWQCVMTLLMDDQFNTEFLRYVTQQRHLYQGDQYIEAWLCNHGYDITVADLAQVFEYAKLTSLVPWTQTYHMTGVGELQIRGSISPSAEDQVSIDGVAVKNARFSKGELTWSSKDGNQTSGSLRFTASDRGVGDVTGVVWQAEDEKPSKPNVASHGSGRFKTVAIGHLVVPLTSAIVRSMKSMSELGDPKPENSDQVMQRYEELETQIQQFNRQLKQLGEAL